MTLPAIRRQRLWAVLIALIALSGPILAQTTSVNLSWNASTSPIANDYQVSYGLTSGAYTAVVDAGDQTNVTITGLTPGLTYYFAVAAYDSEDVASPFSNEVKDSIPALPVIVTSPASQTAIAGANVVLSVTATSSVAKTYQWFDGANPLVGATNATLTLNSIASGSAGNYSVVVSNSSGSVTSQAATVSVLVPPSITGQPVAQTVGAGSNVSLHVTVAGSPPFTFQWFANGAALANGQKETLTLSGVTASNAGSYYVSIGNSVGIAMSATVGLSVTNPPAPNPFATVAGIYNGLFYQVAGTNVNVKYASAGILGNCTVGTNGIYSATLYNNGKSYPLSGQLNASGSNAVTIVRTNSGLSNLLVSLQLDMTGVSKSIAGTVSNVSSASSWSSPFVANLATNALPVPAASFVMTIPPVAGSPNSPVGDGFLLVTVLADTASISGYLYDGSLVSQSVPIAGDGFIPVYSSLYSGLGILEGWVDLAGDSANGWLTWIRPAGITTAIAFPAGFTNTNITIGSGL